MGREARNTRRVRTRRGTVWRQQLIVTCISSLAIGDDVNTRGMEERIIMHGRRQLLLFRRARAPIHLYICKIQLHTLSFATRSSQLLASSKQASYKHSVDGKKWPTLVMDRTITRDSEALFSSEKISDLGTVALSFVCDKYYLIMD